MLWSSSSAAAWVSTQMETTFINLEFEFREPWLLEYRCWKVDVAIPVDWGSFIA